MSRPNRKLIVLIGGLLLTGCSPKSADSPKKPGIDRQLAPLHPVKTLTGTKETVGGPYEELLSKLVPGSSDKREQTDWYGLYMQGQKVGWMNSFTKLTPNHVEIGSIMMAKIKGMGRTTEMTVKESHIFDRQSGRMLSFEFRQDSPDQMGLIQRGQCQNDLLKVEITTGSQKQYVTATCKTGLGEQLALNKIILDNPQEGAESLLENYEPAMMQMVKIQHKISKIEDTLVDGVTSRQIHISENTIEPPGTGVSSETVYDQSARLLFSEVGGFFTARLESEEEAKRPSSSRDILVASVVKLPDDVSEDLLYGSYKIEFSGFPQDFQLPADSSGQQVRRQDNHVIFSLKKQSVTGQSPTLPLAHTPDLAPYLQDEWQYQSAAPEIVNLAKKLTAGRPDLWSAHREILDYVYRNLQKVYVPAMPNAVDVLKIGKGDCTEHSTLYVALARAAGIPARQAVGIVYWPQGGGFGWHAWAEIFNGSEWIAVDPTWGQEVADPSHLRLASGSMGEQVRISGLLGSLRIVSITGNL